MVQRRINKHKKDIIFKIIPSGLLVQAEIRRNYKIVGISWGNVFCISRSLFSVLGPCFCIITSEG